MAANLQLHKLKPLLIDCEIHEGERNLVLEHPTNGKQVVLPQKNLLLLSYLDGTSDIQEISSLLYQDQGEVSFHSIITTIRLLQESDFLEGVEDGLKQAEAELSPHEQKPSLLNAPLFEKKLLNKIQFPRLLSKTAFYGLSALLLVSLLANWSAFGQLNFARFLKSPQGYDEALWRLFLFSSMLMTLKTLFQGMLLLFSSGKILGLSLRLHPFGASVGVNDNGIYSHSDQKIIVAFGMVSASLYLISFSLLQQVPFFRVYRNDLAVLSFLLTFMELNPYRRSDLTKLFYFFYAESQLKNVVPYLKNCTLTGIWKDSGAKLSDELRYVTYSVLAITWAIGFSLFGLEVFVKCFPPLLHQIQLGSTLSRVSALAVLSILFFVNSYLLYDLMHTVGKNILSPLLRPLQKMGSRPRVMRNEEFSNEVIKQHLKSNLVFRELSESALDCLVENGKVRSLKQGSHLIVQGDEGRDVYFLLKGSVEVNVREKTGRVRALVKLGPHTTLGELAILEQKKRSANVVAVEDIIYLAMSEQIFSELLQQAEFQQDLQRLKSRIEISRFVASADLFKDFPAEVMNLFVESGDLVLFPKGHDLVVEGEQDKTFYLLIKGEVEVFKGHQKVVSLKQGDFFGEIALIANVPRTATVKTSEDCLFLYIEDKRFWRLLSENLELAMYIESVGRHRMKGAA